MVIEMVDIHSHILFGIDDGCKSIEDSVITIKRLEELGFDKIILTPHFIKGASYSADNKEKKEKFNLLKEKLVENKVNVELYLGNEIFIDEKIDELILDKKIRSLNNSRYLLIELPFNNQINNIEDYLYELRLKGFIPIIAHPERYLFFQKNHEEAKKMYESGIFFQCNYESIIGKYGKDAMELFIYLLKGNMISFLGTDIHKPDAHIFENFESIKSKIKEYISLEKFEQITKQNVLKVLNDEDIEHEEVVVEPKKKRWFF